MARQTAATKEGKHGVNETGEIIDLDSGVRNRTAYVDPVPGIRDKIPTKFGWGNISEEHNPLLCFSIGTPIDDEIRLKSEV